MKHLDDMIALHALQVKRIITDSWYLARKHVDGQVAAGDLVLAYDEGMLDCVHHLAHVSRPRIGKETIFSLIRERWGRASYLLSIAINKILGKQRNIFTAKAQRRQQEAEHGEAEIEILPKTSVGNLFLQVAVGSGKDAHIHTSSLGVAHLYKLTRLQYAE